MTKKKFTLEDFYSKKNNSTATKMDLLYDGKKTGCHFMVLGIEAKEIQRARIVSQVAYADAAEQAEKITDKVDRTEFEREEREGAEKLLAVELVTDWSFDDFSKEKLKELLDQNQGLAFSVIAHATTPSNYLKK